MKKLNSTEVRALARDLLKNFTKPVDSQVLLEADRTDMFKTTFYKKLEKFSKQLKLHFKDIKAKMPAELHAGGHPISPKLLY